MKDDEGKSEEQGFDTRVDLMTWIGFKNICFLTFGIVLSHKVSDGVLLVKNCRVLFWVLAWSH